VKSNSSAVNSKALRSLPVRVNRHGEKRKAALAGGLKVVTGRHQTEWQATRDPENLDKPVMNRKA
jgi:hypothetical protein